MDFNLQTRQVERLLHHSNAPRRHLKVQENNQHRWLEIDGVVQSVMQLANPAALCLPHLQRIACLLPHRAERILELGLGGGDLARYLRHRWPNAHHQCVDLDEEVIAVYRRFFQHTQQDDNASPRLHHCDALTFLEQSTEQYDLVLLDLFSQDGNPLLLFQARLYQALAPRLQGDLLINLLPRTQLELTRALTLIEQWIGPATPYPVPGLVNIIIHATPHAQAPSDL